MAIEMKGFDKLMRELQQVSAAFEENDGKLGMLSFDPNDPVSIEAAIQEAERLVDDKTSAYPSNPLLAQLGDQMKERYREAIVERASAARLEQDDHVKD